MTKATATDWLRTVPNCLAGDVCDARDLDEAVALATTQLDLIREGQDGTEEYTKRDVRTIERWIARSKEKLAAAWPNDPTAKTRALKAIIHGARDILDNAESALEGVKYNKPATAIYCLGEIETDCDTLRKQAVDARGLFST